jgi:thiol-disulfide isomerase/thioredoxin
MINNFYCTGRAWWYNDTAELRKMCEEGKKATPTMCGRIAPDLNMSDTAGNMHKLYDNLGKNLTILFFYDPTCGHCKEVIPVVNAVFQKHKLNGIKVYAVSTENKYEEWREMMRKRPELGEWVNVCKTDRYYPWPLNKYDYNIVANPTLFVLDNNAKIIGKKIDEHQLEFFIESLLFEKGIINVKPIPPSDKKDESSKDEVKDSH